MKVRYCLCALACLATTAMLAASTSAQQQPAGIVAPPAKQKPLVQIALLLDTSNSMDGLIGQAKTQLWKIVNEFSKGQRDGQHPQIQVALYQYGTPTLGV